MSWGVPNWDTYDSDSDHLEYPESGYSRCIVLIFQLSTGKNRLDSLVVETWKAEALFSASHRTARTFAKMLQLCDVWGLSGLSTSRRGGVSDVKHTAPPGMIQVRSN